MRVLSAGEPFPRIHTRVPPLCSGTNNVLLYLSRLRWPMQFTLFRARGEAKEPGHMQNFLPALLEYCSAHLAPSLLVPVFWPPSIHLYTYTWALCVYESSGTRYCPWDSLLSMGLCMGWTSVQNWAFEGKYKNGHGVPLEKANKSTGVLLLCCTFFPLHMYPFLAWVKYTTLDIRI